MTAIYFTWEAELNITDAKCKAILKYYDGKADTYYEADIDVIWQGLDPKDKVTAVKGDPIPGHEEQSYSKIIVERVA